MDDVWSSDSGGKVRIIVAGVTTEHDAPITAELVKRLAANAGIKKFNVQDDAGNAISASAFPYNGNVEIVEYNEVGAL